jgi:2,4-dienoyl-CoA reductase-like NADH-dependent reductase (Old Yellow Enzyme family)
MIGEAIQPGGMQAAPRGASGRTGLRRDLKALLDPIRVGRVDLKNRVVLAPLSLYLADGPAVSRRLADFYAARARGGVGLVVCTFAAWRLPEGAPWAGYIPSLHDDAQIREVRRLVDRIHESGAKTCVQLYCAAERPGGESVGPSAVPVLRHHLPPVVPRELNGREIRHAVGEIAEASRRSREAGFDMVQFHAMGGDCFISRFLAAATNTRTDRYGGTATKRLNVLLEVLDRSRQLTGKDFTYMARISGEGFREGAPTLEEQKKAAVLLEAAGFDALDITPGWRGQTISTADKPEGSFAYLAAAIKTMVKVPVATGTRYVDPAVAGRVVSEGKADLVSMGRALIADPDLVRKAAAGRRRDIRACTGCQWCRKRIDDGKSIECTVNPGAGREGTAGPDDATIG